MYNATNADNAGAFSFFRSAISRWTGSADATSEACSDCGGAEAAPASSENSATSTGDAFERSRPGANPYAASFGSTTSGASAQNRGAGGDVSGRGLNRGSQNLRSASGRIPASAWDNPTSEIAGRLTQNPARGSISRSDAGVRCGAANMLAASIANGPASTSSLLRSVAGRQSNNLTSAQRTRLRQIATRVDNRTARFEDLNEAQSLLYRSANTSAPVGEVMAEANQNRSRLSATERTRFDALRNKMNGPSGVTPAEARELSTLMTKATGRQSTLVIEDDPQHPGDASRSHYNVRIGADRAATDRSGYDDSELANLANQGGGLQNRSVPLEPNAYNADYSSAMLERLVGRLQPGQAATVRVASNDNDNDANHFITVGRRPDGTPYLYNSDPGQGDYTMYVGNGSDLSNQPQDFTAQLRRYSARFRYDPDGDAPNAVLSQF